MAAFTETDPRVQGVAHVAEAIRTALHDQVEKRLEKPETVYTDDGHAFSIGTSPFTGDTVIVVDGAEVAFDADGIARLCKSLLHRVVKSGDANFQIMAAERLLDGYCAAELF